MPASRVHFAIADLYKEITRLLPPESKPTIRLGLDPATHDAIERELQSYGVPRLEPGERRQPIKFLGVELERLPE